MAGPIPPAPVVPPVSNAWYAGILSFFTNVMQEIQNILGIAEADAPALLDFLSVASTVLTAYFPGIGLAEYLSDATFWVNLVASYVKTIDNGITSIMSAAEAAAIGATVVTVAVPPTPSLKSTWWNPFAPDHKVLNLDATLIPMPLTDQEMSAFVVQTLGQAWPDVPEHCHLLAIYGQVSKLIGPPAGATHQP